MHLHKLTIQLNHRPWRKWQDSYRHNIKTRISTPTIIIVTKKGDKNGKKDDEAKSEDRDNNNTDTIGAHVGEKALAEDNSGASLLATD